MVKVVYNNKCIWECWINNKFFEVNTIEVKAPRVNVSGDMAKIMEEKALETRIVRKKLGHPFNFCWDFEMPICGWWGYSLEDAIIIRDIDKFFGDTDDESEEHELISGVRLESFIFEEESLNEPNTGNPLLDFYIRYQNR
mgnify:CR=1 FL=1